MIKIKAESIALNRPTRVTCNDKVLETQGLDLKTLCDLWKWYFNISPFEKVELKCETKLYHTLEQSPLSSTKSMIELFAEQGIDVVETKIIGYAFRNKTTGEFLLKFDLLDYTPKFSKELNENCIILKNKEDMECFLGAYWCTKNCELVEVEVENDNNTT